mgnify:CR=1 FL=1
MEVPVATNTPIILTMDLQKGNIRTVLLFSVYKKYCGSISKL